ncbi:MAG: 2-dehydro-3-deoxyglucarate aldolase [Halomonas sp. 54_146]|nr:MULTISPECIES: aldolase/citrate lyase family protein [unclassified Halomonas]KUJ86898.1 MAG: 2-dehydro-3-deoxyglucarate aldolase [Halomonas sp. 54_146]HAA44946.1 aldolase [Halomonas sp.]
MSLITKMQSGIATGIFSKTLDSAFVEAAGLAGLDFIILDTEHGPASLETLHHHVRAARLTPMQAIIRVKGVEPHAIGCALDTGAAGVQVPNINSAEQAREAVNAARFHPHGQRGVCRFVRAAQFGDQEKAQYFQQANQAVVILQVEGLEGVKNLDQILDVPGFDVLFVGPYDLSQSVGKPGEVDAPEVIALMREIAAKSKAKGVLLGAFCDTPENAKLLRAEGFSYIAYSVDVNIFLEAIKNLDI